MDYETVIEVQRSFGLVSAGIEVAMSPHDADWAIFLSAKFDGGLRFSLICCGPKEMDSHKIVDFSDVNTSLIGGIDLIRRVTGNVVELYLRESDIGLLDRVQSWYEEGVFDKALGVHLDPWRKALV